MESYDDIFLTEDEVLEAMIAAKSKKKEALRLKRIKEIEEYNRRFKQTQFNADMAKTFFVNRAEKLFKGQFVLDEFNEPVFDMLCRYFSDDSTFLTLASAYGVENPSMSKGILLAGNFGTGKSWLMKLFMQNKKQSYFIRYSKDIANEYLKSKEKVIPPEYFSPFPISAGDSSVFYQRVAGLCIDDIGAEAVKNNFGNISNVLGDLLEHRYNYEPSEEIPNDCKLVGPMLHGTTNLTAKQLSEYYGGRAISRMREIYNFIIMKGTDRRK